MRKVFDKIEEVVAFVSLFVMTLITFINVIMRQFGGLSLSFTEEISVNMFVLVTLMGTSIAAKRREHLGVTAVFDRFSPSVRKACRVFALSLTVVYLGIIIGYGIRMVNGEILLNQKTPTMQWPEWIFGSFIVIGAVLIFIRYLLRLFDTIKTKPEEVK